MLDLKFVRENPEIVRKAIEVKRVNLNLDDLLKADQAALDLRKKQQALQEEKNANAKKVPAASPADRPGFIERGKQISVELGAIGPEIEAADLALKQLLWMTPNIPAIDVPVGKDDTENVEAYKRGELPKFDFKPLDHVQLIDKHDWAELERIAKVSGSRMYALKNDLAMLEFALIHFALDALRAKGSTVITVPSLVREPALFGTGHFPTGRDQVYHLKEDDLYLSGTGEVPVNSLHSGEILKPEQLPLRYAAFSPCFRREAGSAGKDTRGLIRVHQFNKVEQFVFCRADVAEMEHWHKEILRTSEEIVEALEMPYRVLTVCTGDMGAGKFRMHDIEVYVPSEGVYRETHSCSSLTDWQSRRSNVRYRDTDDKVKFVYTLNNTAIATPRVLVPFLENHQTASGAVRIPAALQKYMGGRQFIGE